MDSIIINIFINSKLSDKTKELLLKLFQSYYDKNYGHLTVGDAYALVKDLLVLEADLKDSHFDEETYTAFIYTYAKNYCLKEIRYPETRGTFSVWNFMYETLIKNTLLNSDNRKYFLSLDNTDTSIMEFLKKIAILIEELVNLINANKSYLVLKKYHEIVNLCNYQGLDSSLLEKGNEDKLKETLEKKYSIYSRMRYPIEYRNYIKKRQLSKEESFKPDNFVYQINPNPESFMVQKLLHQIMAEYYKQTGFIYRPYAKDINLYYLGNIVIVAYRYDNVPNMALKNSGLTLKWEDRDFWAKVFDPDIDFVDGDAVNYFITKEEINETYKVVSLAFDNNFFKSLGKKVIFAPEEYLDEALYSALTENDTLPLDLITRYNLGIQGFNFENLTNKLMSGDFSFYFKDPTKVDELEVENLENHQYLNLIKTKEDPKSRKRSIAGIIAASKKNPKKPETPIEKRNNKKFSKKLSYKSEKKARLPYRDD